MTSNLRDSKNGIARLGGVEATAVSQRGQSDTRNRWSATENRRLQWPFAGNEQPAVRTADDFHVFQLCFECWTILVVCS